MNMQVSLCNLNSRAQFGGAGYEGSVKSGIKKKYTSAKLKILPATYIVVPGELFFTERYIRFTENYQFKFPQRQADENVRYVIFSPFPRIHISYDENEGLIPSVAGTRDTLLFSFD